MKQLNIILVTCLIALTGQVSAAGLTGIEAVPMAYMSLPLGAKHVRNNQPSYGFGFAVAEHRQDSSTNFMSTGKARLVDFSFTGDELTALEINGINTLEQTLVHHADGTTSTSTGINYTLFVPAAIVGIVVAVEAGEKDTIIQESPSPE